MSKPVNEGEVIIELDGEPVILKCTLLAAKTVNAALDGFVGAFRRVQQFDLEAFGLIVAVGMGKKIPADLNDITEKVYATGMRNLSDDVTKFLTLLSNGGRESSTGSKEASEGNG